MCRASVPGRSLITALVLSVVVATAGAHAQTAPESAGTASEAAAPETAAPEAAQPAAQPAAPAVSANAQTEVPAPTEAAPPEPDPAEARRATIRYGIDTEIIELLKTLGKEKDASYRDELSLVLGSTRSPKLRIAILELFSTLEWNGAEAAAMAFVEDRGRADQSLVLAALSYLAAVRSKEALALCGQIVAEEDLKLMPGAVRLMGRAGGGAEEEILLGLFESDAASEALRQEAIRALGEIGSSKAAERLAAIAEDPEKGKATRMFACEALAKIGDSQALPALVKAANGDDPNVRTKAIEALGAFASAEAEAAIVEALRDSFPAARAAACKASAKRRIAAALPFLEYRAEKDPDKSVRTEAFKALAALGGEAFAFLRERMGDKKENAAMRVLCFGLLARHDAEVSMSALEAWLAAEAQAKDRSMYTSLAREIANAQDAPLAGSLAKILLEDKDHLIRVAGIEWIRKNKAVDMRETLAKLAEADPSELIRKRAAEALRALNASP